MLKDESKEHEAAAEKLLESDDFINDIIDQDRVFRAALVKLIAAALADAVRVARESLCDDLANWAEGQWDAEVRHRPDVNVYREMLDTTWKKVMRKAEELRGADPGRLDLLELGWLVIANAHGGNWDKESAEWQEVAARFRERYHAALAARVGEGDDPPSPEPAQPDMRSIREHARHARKP